MAVQLMNLRGVPDDEADAVRQLLDQHAIRYYETPPGNWGISIPALWLHDDSQLERAQALLDAYQAERLQQARSEYQQQRSAGQHNTLFKMIASEPLKFIVYIAIAAAVLYFSVVPFLELAYS